MFIEIKKCGDFWTIYTHSELTMGKSDMNVNDERVIEFYNYMDSNNYEKTFD